MLVSSGFVSHLRKQTYMNGMHLHYKVVQPFQVFKRVIPQNLKSSIAKPLGQGTVPF